MLARALTRRIAHSSLPPTLSTVYRRSMNGTAAVAKGLNSDGSLNKKALIPFSSRLLDGRALAQDVWSIYKYVAYCSSPIDILICALAVQRIFQPIASILVRDI